MDWEELEKQILNCKKCPLYKYARNKVIGDGNKNSDIVFIGEAPGEEEDKQGKPFVGRAGQLLNKLLEKIGLTRDQIYITNVLKCRPPNNRDPKEEEIEACKPYLVIQLDLIKPTYIVTLGRFATKEIFDLFGLKFSSITKVRGKPYYVRRWNKIVTIFPTLHPAAALYHTKYLPIIEQDFEKLKEIISNNKRGLLKFI